MTGTLSNGDFSQTVNLSYGNNTDDIKGFNLLGNPTAHEITFDKTNEVSDGYYYLDNGETWTYSLDNTVPVGRGFLVKANATGQTVTLNPQSKRGNAKENTAIPSLIIDVDGEQAYVKLTEGVGMPMASFNDRSSSIYLSRDGKPYVMLPRDDADRIELNYQPSHEGQHLLHVDINQAELPYLHLIDRRNGNDIDLIANPNYQFNSGSNDYAARFQLSFGKSTDNNSNDLFAYCQNGRIVVTDPNPQATLHIIDMTGRMINNDHLAPGVYVLRLITPERIRTQQIVVPN